MAARIARQSSGQPSRKAGDRVLGLDEHRTNARYTTTRLQTYLRTSQ